MKMVIVQTEKKSAIALRDDGTFIKIPQRGYSVGQAVELLSEPKSFMRFSRAAIAAAIVIVLISSSGIMAAFMPYSYVTMDINPSVKYTLNAFDRVLSVDAVNEDAEAIVEALNEEGISYQKISDIIELTITQCRDSGYVSESAEDYVVLSVMSVSSGKTAKLADKLGGNHFGGGFVSAKIVSSTISNMKQAAKKGTTPGKLMLISEMQEITGDKKPAEDWINVPVRDIMSAAKGSDGKHSGQSNNNESQSHGRKQTTSKDEDLSLTEVSTSTDASEAQQSGTQAADNTPASVSTRGAESQLQQASQKSNGKSSSSNSGELTSTQSSDTSSEEAASQEQKSSQEKEIPPGQDISQEQETPPGQELSQGQETPPGQEPSQGQDTPPGQEISQEQATPPGQETSEWQEAPKQKESSSGSSEEKSGKTTEDLEPNTFSSDDSKESGDHQSNEASKN